jgi:hypothetical protein
MKRNSEKFIIKANERRRKKKKIVSLKLIFRKKGMSKWLKS